jgi:hypothetical protein
MALILLLKDRVADQIKKQDTTICCLQMSDGKRHTKTHNRIKVKGWKIILQENKIQKTAVATVISEKTKTKTDF